MKLDLTVIKNETCLEHEKAMKSAKNAKLSKTDCNRESCHDSENKRRISESLPEKIEKELQPFVGRKNNKALRRELKKRVEMFLDRGGFLLEPFIDERPDFIKNADHGLPLKELSTEAREAVINHKAQLTRSWDSGRKTIIDYKVLGIDKDYIYIKVNGDR